jgi:putative ABC transport system permease protein
VRERGGRSTATLLPVRLAWRQLRHEPRKLLAGVAGVVFAVVLMFMQFGYRDAMFDSAAAVQRQLSGDLFIAHRQSQTLWRMAPFSRRRVLQTLAVPDVAEATYLYVGLGDWKNPWTAKHRAILIFGIDPAIGLLELSGVPEQLDAIKDEDAVLYDAHSHPEFGPVATVMRDGQQLSAEVNHRRLYVRGLFRLGASFTADGNLVTSHENFLRILPERRPSQADLGVIRLRPGANRAAAQAAVARLMPSDVRVLTRDELVRLEHDYWENATGIGFVFTLGALMGFVVGVVIVYQILYTEVANHLAQYATLTAMGHPHRFLLGIVAGAAMILSVLGYVPGFLLSLTLYRLTERVTFLPMIFGVAKPLLVFGLTIVMCFVSGGMALRKLREADPADLF